MMVFYSSMTYDYLEEYVPFTWKDVLGKVQSHQITHVKKVCITEKEPLCKISHDYGMCAMQPAFYPSLIQKSVLCQIFI